MVAMERAEVSEAEFDWLARVKTEASRESVELYRLRMKSCHSKWQDFSVLCLGRKSWQSLNARI